MDQNPLETVFNCKLLPVSNNLQLKNLFQTSNGQFVIEMLLMVFLDSHFIVKNIFHCHISNVMMKLIIFSACRYLPHHSSTLVKL